MIDLFYLVRLWLHNAVIFDHRYNTLDFALSICICDLERFDLISANIFAVLCKLEMNLLIPILKVLRFP